MKTEGVTICLWEDEQLLGFTPRRGAVPWPVKGMTGVCVNVRPGSLNPSSRSAPWHWNKQL